MAAISRALVSSFLLPLAACVATASPSSADTIIADVSVFDAEAGTLAHHRDVAISGELIVAVVAAGSTDFAAPRMVDGRGLTLLPGLINAHVHLQLSEDPQTGMEDLLRRGVTTVRDLAGDARTPAALEARRRAGEAAVPEIIFAALLAGPRHMEDPRTFTASGDYPPGEAPWMRAVTHQSDIASIIAEARGTGASGIKVYASMDRALLAAVTEEAHAQRMQVWMHSVIFPANTEDALAAGPDQLIHAKGLASMDDSGLPDTFAEGVQRYMTTLALAERDPADPYFRNLFVRIRDAGVMLEPALIADGDVQLARGRQLPPPMAALRDWACRATGEAWRSGVLIGAGTDYHGEGGLLLMELMRMHECGLPIPAVLVAATRNNARALGLGDRTGLVAPGYEADLLLVEGDPTQDLSALENLRMVFANGREVVRD